MRGHLFELRRGELYKFPKLLPYHVYSSGTM